MSDLIAVTPQECQELSWLPPEDCHFVAGRSLLPLAANEMAMAASSMPLALVKLGKPARWQLMAVCGLHTDHNLFVNAQGQWLGHYRPRVLQTWPFETLRLPGRDSSVLLFDRSSGLLRDDGVGEPFFDASGQPMPRMGEVIGHLQQQERAKAATEAALAALAAAGLLMPWPDKLLADSGMAIEGLHCVDEQALSRLDDAAFLKLRRALPVAYAVNLALQQVHLLVRLARLQGQGAPAGVSFEDVFGEEESFNFDSLLGDNNKTH